jgi:hypothetical protein
LRLQPEKKFVAENLSKEDDEETVTTQETGKRLFHFRSDYFDFPFFFITVFSACARFFHIIWQYSKPQQQELYTKGNWRERERQNGRRDE